MIQKTYEFWIAQKESEVMMAEKTHCNDVFQKMLKAEMNLKTLKVKIKYDLDIEDLQVNL